MHHTIQCFNAYQSMTHLPFKRLLSVLCWNGCPLYMFSYIVHHFETMTWWTLFLLIICAMFARNEFQRRGLCTTSNHKKIYINFSEVLLTNSTQWCFCWSGISLFLLYGILIQEKNKIALWKSLTRIQTKNIQIMIFKLLWILSHSPFEHFKCVV